MADLSHNNGLKLPATAQEVGLLAPRDNGNFSAGVSDSAQPCAGSRRSTGLADNRGDGTALCGVCRRIVPITIDGRALQHRDVA